ncbi:hypothetical protein M2352_003565 [Azospirillum fermentarium]|uniref:eCIS core domain-containing protein n=1 Tax=Azospirillum fermentarium TaxID=1233114 RepID=UPI002225E825|nr:DUF4157 domain-containing protein [Azospirillum fermentarium]MCW2247931.1 hypothetical protein [Azospirillum fermentarium]
MPSHTMEQRPAGKTGTGHRVPPAAAAGPMQARLTQLAAKLDAAPRSAGLQALSDTLASPVQRQPNRTGLPDALKTGMETRTGVGLDSVRVHYGSSRPAQFKAHAITQGTEIHVAPGQEGHLPHELGHVVQQMQGRVPVTTQMKGIPVNADPVLEAEATMLGGQAVQTKPIQRRADGPAGRPTAPRFAARGIIQRMKSPPTSTDGETHNETIGGVLHQRIPINSSKARFLRRIQFAEGGSRNFVQVKFVKGRGKTRKVLYVLARSMGMGKSKLTLSDEKVRTKVGGFKKRSHSEAVMRAVRHINKLNTGSDEYDLDGYKVNYVTSTNEACGEDHENCRAESVPYLGTKNYNFLNPYTGSDDAAGFEKLNNAHRKKLKNDDAYESEAESEDEYDTLVVDDGQFEGVDFKTDTMDQADVTPLADIYEDRSKRTKMDYEGKDLF